MNMKSIKTKIIFCFGLLLVLLVIISYEGYFGPNKVLEKNTQIDEMQSMLQDVLQARRYEKNMIIRRDVESKENALQYINKIKLQSKKIQQDLLGEKYQQAINEIISSTNEYENLLSKLNSLISSSNSSYSELGKVRTSP